MQRRFLAGAALAAALPALARRAIAQTAPAPPSPDQPAPSLPVVPDARRMAERFAETLTAHDTVAFAALFADDYQQHQTSAAAPPPATALTPKQATIAYFAARVIGLPDLVVTADPIVAEADRVAANFTYTGTHRATYLGFPPTGRRITFTSCDILLVRNGLFVAHWGAADLAGLLQQLRG
jgi:predicted ester cyclase